MARGLLQRGVIPANESDEVFSRLHRIEGDKPVAPRENLRLGPYRSAARGSSVRTDRRRIVGRAPPGARTF